MYNISLALLFFSPVGGQIVDLEASPPNRVFKQTHGTLSVQHLVFLLQNCIPIIVSLVLGIVQIGIGEGRGAR